MLSIKGILMFYIGNLKKILRSLVFCCVVFMVTQCALGSTQEEAGAGTDWGRWCALKAEDDGLRASNLPQLKAEAGDLIKGLEKFNLECASIWYCRAQAAPSDVVLQFLLSLPRAFRESFYDWVLAIDGESKAPCNEKFFEAGGVCDVPAGKYARAWLLFARDVLFSDDNSSHGRALFYITEHLASPTLMKLAGILQTFSPEELSAFTTIREVRKGEKNEDDFYARFRSMLEWPDVIRIADKLGGAAGHDALYKACTDICASRFACVDLEMAAIDIYFASPGVQASITGEYTKWVEQDSAESAAVGRLLGLCIHIPEALRKQRFAELLQEWEVHGEDWRRTRSSEAYMDSAEGAWPGGWSGFSKKWVEENKLIEKRTKWFFHPMGTRRKSAFSPAG